MKKILPICLIAGLVVTAATANDFERDVKARQSQFQLMLFNISSIGGMARGNTEYDPVLASQAAANLVSISQLHQMPMWPEGSDDASIEDTRALPAIWQDTDGFIEKWQAFGTAATGLAEVAGDGQQALGPAVGAVGQTCTACHESFRTPDD